jgi:glycosyltransferase involved in cell wall biosynthesis
VKVLHVSPTYFPATYWGGPIYSVLGLNNALARSGADVRVLTTDAAGPKLQHRLDVDVLNPVEFGPRHTVYYSRRVAGAEISIQLLTRLLPLARWADVVHLTATYSYPTIPTLLACRALGRPLVWSPRGGLQATHEWRGVRRRRLKSTWEHSCSLILRRTRSALHVTSIEEKEASLARIRIGEARVIRNGVEVPDQMVPRTWTPNGDLRLLFLGRLDPKKGIENLLQTLVLLRDRTVTLDLLGTGNNDYVAHLASMTKALGIESCVRFRGHVDGQEKTNAFARADLCIAPSHSENFCMVVAESLAHGVPVVASTGTPWQRLPQRGCGEWINNSPASLATAIKRLRAAPLEEMGRRGRAWMKEEFGWDAIAKEMQELYQSLAVPIHA